MAEVRLQEGESRKCLVAVV